MCGPIGSGVCFFPRIICHQAHYPTVMLELKRNDFFFCSPSVNIYAGGWCWLGVPDPVPLEEFGVAVVCGRLKGYQHLALPPFCFPTISDMNDCMMGFPQNGGLARNR